MNQVSQMGVVMANFGNLLTSMAQVVEEEMMTAIRDEQLAAEDSEKILTAKANEQITQANDTINGLQTNLLRSNQQLKVAADKLAEAEAEAEKLRATQSTFQKVDCDKVLASLDALSKTFVALPDAATRESVMSMLTDITVALAPIVAMFADAQAAAPKKAPNLADVAEAVVANVKDAAKA